MILCKKCNTPRQKLFAELSNVRPKKIKGLFALLAWKLRWPGRSIFFFFFFFLNKSGHRRNVVSFMYVHSWACRTPNWFSLGCWRRFVFHYIWSKCLSGTVNIYSDVLLKHFSLKIQNWESKKKKKKKNDSDFLKFSIGRKVANKYLFLGLNIWASMCNGKCQEG